MNRKKKNDLITKFNPEWKFLIAGLTLIESVYEVDN